MKLRIRSLETKETVRIEIEGTCSLLQLKTLIASKLSSSSSPESLSLSLNQKDELFSSNPSAPLHSLGLASGDLLFCSQTLTKIVNEDPIQGMNTPMAMDETLIPQEKTQAHEEIEIDMETVSSSSNNCKKKFPSVPCFLKRVLESEKQEIKENLGFLVVAVHAVFLESGFVVWNGGGGGDTSRLPTGWNLPKTAVSVSYTVPDLLIGQTQDRNNNVKFVILKFSAMKNHVSVYGSLTGEPGVYRLCLDLPKVVSLLLFLSDTVSREEEEHVFNFWKAVKDGLCLRLLIDVCDKNGLPPPPCFGRLPTELKMKVLELLPGVDVASFGSSSSEMRYLASNDDLWKQKFMEEFGQGYESEVASVRSWKEKFSRCWVKRRDMNNTQTPLLENRYGYQRRIMPRYPPFSQQRFPFVGGDYDRFPVFGDRDPLGPGFAFPRLTARTNFSPNCNLGGRSGNFIG